MPTYDTIYVTQPFLPPLEEFVPYLGQIWDRGSLTNAARSTSSLKMPLCEDLGVEHLALFANGTLALVTALQALRITGEVITTPYSFVATAHSLLWNGITPVFVDVEPGTLNLDPKQSRGDHAAHDGDHAGALLRPPVRRRRHPGDRRDATA